MFVGIIFFLSFISIKRANVWIDEYGNALERVKEYPDNYLERNNLATVYIAMGLLDDAERELNTAMVLSEKHQYVTYLNMSYLYQLKGEHKKAVELVERYLDYDGKNVSALYTYGVLKQKEGDIKKAKDAYEKALDNSKEENVEKANILNNLGIIYFQLGDRKKGIDCINKAYKIAPFLDNVKENYERSLQR